MNPDSPPAPVLSAVMPCYNEGATVAQICTRVLASPYTAELIVVDNGSSDGTVAQLDTFDRGGTDRLAQGSRSRREPGAPSRRLI